MKPVSQSRLKNSLHTLDSLLADLESASPGLNTTSSRDPMPPVPPLPANYEPPPVRGRPVETQGATISMNVNELDDLLKDLKHNNGVSTKPPQSSTNKASAATKELEDLIASLSDFKYNPSTKVEITNPEKSIPPPQTAVRPVEPEPKPKTGTLAPAPADPNPRLSQLDTALGNLTSDMNRQGINTTSKGVCAACNKTIFGQVCTALGRTWHPEHFVCAVCGLPLGSRTFFERDGKPYCEEDYREKFAPRCASCGGPIINACVTAMDLTWHPEHFVCTQCSRPFGDSGFHEKDGKPYCREDYLALYAPRCGACDVPITDNYISALNTHWHTHCFNCMECHTSFQGGSFFEHEGFPYCELHYHAKRGSLCHSCQKPITGRCITAMQRKFHPEHFVCAFCLKQLNKGTFKEQGDKPYCHPCFAKLFGN